MTAENIEMLGQERFSSKAGDDRGVGFIRATQKLESWEGRIFIYSDVAKGTRVTIEMPRLERSGFLRRIVETVSR